MNCPPPNPFLHALFKKGSSLLTSCEQHATVILAPVASSLAATDAESGVSYDDNLTEEFIQSHILRIATKDEVVQRARARVYTTVNGKTLVIKEDAVFPHRGFRGVKEVRLLHDTLFWLDDPSSAPYLVYFLDRPLIGSPVPKVSTTKPGRRKITTWEQLVDTYELSHLEGQLDKLFDEFAESVVRMRRDLKEIKNQLEAVVSGAIRAFQGLPQASLHAIGQETGLTGSAIERIIEVYILDRLYDHIFYQLTTITQEKDEEIASAIESAKHVDLTQLGTYSTLDLRQRHRAAIETFKGFGELHSPAAKLDALLATIGMLMRNSEKSSDDLIPSLVSVVLRASVSNLAANILWIKEFSFAETDTGESGYALSTLEAVIYHITSSTYLAPISADNFKYFASVCDGTATELWDIRSIHDKTPLQLGNPDFVARFAGQSTASGLDGILLDHVELLDIVLKLDERDRRFLLNQRDENGQSLAHHIHKYDIFDKVKTDLDWTMRDKQGNTPIQVLARIYDHPEYEDLLEAVLSIKPVNLDDHIDSKGNTLAHVVSTARAMQILFEHCYGDFNKLNDKGLTPLLMAIKFAREPILDVLLDREEVDLLGRDFRGHSAIQYAARAGLSLFDKCYDAGLDVNDRASGSNITALHIAARDGNIPILKRLIELDVEDAWDWRGLRAGDVVKNDVVRGIMDNWACRGREVRVLRGHVGEDCSVRYLIKSKSGGGVLRSVHEFTKLRHWLCTRYPLFGVASIHLGVPSPCLLHSKPSRSALLALTERLDAFVQALLDHSQISADPMLWEFLLSPTIDDETILSRIDAELLHEREQIWREEPLLAYEQSQIFFEHAQNQIVTLSSTYRVLERKSKICKDAQLNLSVAYGLLANHEKVTEKMRDALLPKEPSPIYQFIEDITTIDCRISGLLSSLTIPGQIIDRMQDCKEDIERSERELNKSSKFQLPMLAESQARRKAMIRTEIQALQIELKHAGSELRHNETVLAGELSSFYSAHETNVRSCLKRFMKRQLEVERDRLSMLE